MKNRDFVLSGLSGLSLLILIFSGAGFISGCEWTCNLEHMFNPPAEKPSESSDTPDAPAEDYEVAEIPAREFNALYIGNSQLGLYQVYHITSRIAESLMTNRSVIEHNQVILPGATVQTLWEEGTAGLQLETMQYDTLVIQGYHASSQGDFNLFVQKFAKKAKICGVSKILLFSYSTGIREWSLQIEDKHQKAAEEVPFSILASAEPLFYRFSMDYDRNLLSRADGHPTAAGSYAFALAIYCAITEQDPRGATRIIKDSWENNYQYIEVPEGPVLQRMAAEVYLGL